MTHEDEMQAYSFEAARRDRQDLGFKLAAACDRAAYWESEAKAAKRALSWAREALWAMTLAAGVAVFLWIFELTR